MPSVVPDVKFQINSIQVPEGPFGRILKKQFTQQYPGALEGGIPSGKVDLDLAGTFTIGIVPLI